MQKKKKKRKKKKQKENAKNVGLSFCPVGL